MVENNLKRLAWQPVLALMLISPLVAEVVSSATPVAGFLNLGLLLSYVIFLYGLPVLVIREIAVRRGLGPLGLWCLGVVYGLFNEGLLSQDLFHPFGHAGDGFADYGVVGGVLVPFTIFIGFWHGLFSVTLPVLLVERFFPQQAGRPWLPSVLCWMVAAFSLVAAVLAYFGLGRDDAPSVTADVRVGHLAIIVTAAIALWFIAGRLPRTPRLVIGPSNARGRSFAAGALVFVVMGLTPSVLAEEGVSWGWQPVYFAVVAVVGVWALTRARETAHGNAVTCVMGAGTAHALTTAIFGVGGGDLMLVASMVVLGVVFVAVSAYPVRRRRTT